MIVLVYDAIYGYLNLLILNDYVGIIMRRIANVTSTYVVTRLLRFRYLLYWHPV